MLGNAIQPSGEDIEARPEIATPVSVIEPGALEPRRQP
jgi:hypothetical protein